MSKAGSLNPFQQRMLTDWLACRTRGDDCFRRLMSAGLSDAEADAAMASATERHRRLRFVNEWLDGEATRDQCYARLRAEGLTADEAAGLMRDSLTEWLQRRR